ncbi:hypothetical protein ACFQYP_01030 [Nonomuraea antimicrobica]
MRGLGRPLGVRFREGGAGTDERLDDFPRRPDTSGGGVAGEVSEYGVPNRPDSRASAS